MNIQQDPLIPMKLEKWDIIENEFDKDDPRRITGYNVLQTQKIWLKQGIDYGFEAFCPYGEAKNGIVAVINEQGIYEVIIECPTDDTSKMEEALKKTKNINWEKEFRILYAPFHVVECVRRVVNDIGKEITCKSPLIFYFLDRNTPLFDVNLPQGFTFQPLSQEHIELVDSKWPYRHPGSASYYDLIIRDESGYGLFRDQELVSFGFFRENGVLGHLYTLEDHRKKGFGDILLKMLCNILLKQGKRVNSYCLKKNVPSCKMHEKIGFETVGVVESLYVQ